MGDTGRIPFISLSDIGWWGRHIFDHPGTTTGKNLEIASHLITWPELVETITRVTGIPAEYKRVTMDEYFKLYDGVDTPVAVDVAIGKGPTFEENFRACFSLWRDNIVKRDMDWVRRVHPGTVTLEQWLRDENYNGQMSNILKSNEDEKRAIRRSHLAANI